MVVQRHSYLQRPLYIGSVIWNPDVAITRRTCKGTKAGVCSRLPENASLLLLLLLLLLIVSGVILTKCATTTERASTFSMSVISCE